MSTPRCIRPGAIVMVTRRTLRRTHLLRPDSELNNLYTYCLAVLAARYGVLVHAAVLMSTHEHLILTDVRGQLPRFLQELHRLVALGVKVLRKWEGAVWDHEKTSIVELRTPQAVVEKLAYAMANPVAAGLVQSAERWPGITMLPEQLGQTAWTAARPNFYFDENNCAWPQTVMLQLTLPMLGMPDSAIRESVRVELDALEHSARAEIAAKGWRFMRPEQIPSLSPYHRARSWEATRSRNPSFAVGRGQRDAFSEAVLQLRAFRKAYRTALEQWRTGLRSVLFPAGTWLMRWIHRVDMAST